MPLSRIGIANKISLEQLRFQFLCARASPLISCPDLISGVGRSTVSTVGAL